jgi:hypothetical protein
VCSTDCTGGQERLEVVKSHHMASGEGNWRPAPASQAMAWPDAAVLDAGPEGWPEGCAYRCVSALT